MFTSRLNPFALTALVVLLLTGVTATTARSATPEEIKKQQDQIRERSKETEDKAQSDKQAREREEARKAQELRDKQWKEENPNSPLPRFARSGQSSACILRWYDGTAPLDRRSQCPLGAGGTGPDRF